MCIDMLEIIRSPWLRLFKNLMLHRVLEQVMPSPPVSPSVGLFQSTVFPSLKQLGVYSLSPLLPGLLFRQSSLEHGIQLPQKDRSGDPAAVSLVECLEKRLEINHWTRV